MPEGPEQARALQSCLEQLRRGSEDAWHRLVEAGPGIIPALQDAFDDERDPRVRADLIKILWQYHSLDVIPFLGKVLSSDDDPVWKAALDGLVTLASSESASALECALNVVSQAQRREWVQEALEQVREALRHAGK